MIRDLAEKLLLDTDNTAGVFLVRESLNITSGRHKVPSICYINV